MMKIDKRILAVLGCCLWLSTIVLGQSGGTYVITQSVIATGGGTSNGLPYSLTGTSGQSVAGTNSTGGSFGVRGGFWQGFFAPTASMVAVGGQVLTSEQGGIARVRVTLTDQSGAVRSALTNPFGNFRFDDIEAGQTCFVTVESKRFQFVNPTQVVFVGDEITDLVFTALPF